MARPALRGYYASGWHLHESLWDGRSNVFAPTDGAEPLSKTGRAFLGGLLEHAVPATVFATPTINGYRRFKVNSLAPDRAGWGYDHRGAMVRVLGGAGDPATRLENRIGEPGANPYLFIASQLAAGMDGIARNADPGPREDEPYAADRPLLPKSLPAALEALQASALFKREFGGLFIDYYVKLKRAECARFTQWLSGRQGDEMRGDEPTPWEQDEYFDFF
jgi:glutamine synthetase